jgi:hypothetical protein
MCPANLRRANRLTGSRDDVWCRMDKVEPITDLEGTLDEVRAAPRLSRIELRDGVAAFGAEAVPAMADWIGHPEYTRFAVRVLERVAQRDGGREAAVDALLNGLEDAESDEMVRDIREVLTRLGVRPPASGGRVTPDRTVLPGRPGQPGRHYWAMRTSQYRPDFIWREVMDGRLRQGWGWREEQDLRRIKERRRLGAELGPEERVAWRARRMLATEPAGMRLGDLVVTQNLPRQGRLSVCRVIGSYAFELPDSPDPEDYGHILPVELVAGDIDRWDGQVSEALRHAISLRPRLYEITPYGGDVDALF